MRPVLQTVDHFLGQCLRFYNLRFLILTPTNAQAYETGTFKDIENCGSRASHPKRFVADAWYFLWRSRLLASLFSLLPFSAAISLRFFIAMKSVSPELPGVARARSFSSPGDSHADRFGKGGQ